MKIKNKLLMSLSILPISLSTVPYISTSCSNTSLTVALYANEGFFSSETDNIILNCKPGMKLKDLKNYEIPKSYKSLNFTKWVNNKGKVINEDTTINENQFLTAVYEDTITAPKNFTTDNWATVIKTCESAVSFYNAYVKTNGTLSNDEEQTAIAEIKKWIITNANIRYLPISFNNFIYNIKVRLIDVGHDKAYDSAITKTIFTYECAEVFAASMFNKNAKYWYYEEDIGQGEIKIYNSVVRKYLQEQVINKFPATLKSAIVPVKKTTHIVIPESEEGTKQESQETLFCLSTSELKFTGFKAFEEEGLPYAYYDQIKNDSNDTVFEPLRMKKFYSSDYYTRYWTRTPSDDERIDVVQYITERGYTETTGGRSFYGIAPAFCI